MQVDSPDLLAKMKAEHDVTDAKVGRMLKDLGLVVLKDRPRLPDGSRITRWTINRRRLKSMIKRWEIDVAIGDDLKGGVLTSTTERG